ncbi:MAG: hypothetical protein AABX38_00700 [Candidatus Micrarchaeota archaeon]
MIERKINLPLYVLAFVITIIIFGIGVYFGSVIDNSNNQNIKNDVSDLSNKIYATQMLLLSDDKEIACVALKEQLNSFDSQINDVGQKLSYLENSRSAVDNELKKQYFILETNSYLLSKKQNSNCNFTNSKKDVLILYFYSNKNCENCVKQGVELTEARTSFNGTRTYSFDGDLNSPVADALKNKYNVTSYPTIVINDRVLSGYYSKDQLISEFKK